VVKAIVATRPGDPSVLEWRELAKPEPAPGELLVRLRAAGLNPVDYKLRRRGSFAPKGAEVILGCDGAGIVEAAGTDTTRFVAGDEVFFCDGGFGEKPGNYAEYRVVDERFAARKPERLSFVEAAAVPLVTITAWESLFELATLRAGDFVLVQAGAGGVGHVAVQLARDAGAFVAATISTPEKAALARELGAVATIDYRTEDVAAATRSWSGRDGANVVFDTVGGETFGTSFHAVAPYGRLVTCVESPWPDFASALAQHRNLRIGLEWMPAPAVYGWPGAKITQREILERCTPRLDAGTLRVIVGRTYPLDRVADAHRALEAGDVTGKIVLEIE